MTRYHLIFPTIALAACAASPVVPTGADGKPPAIACVRLTSIYGVGTTIAVNPDKLDPAAVAPGVSLTMTTDGNDCKTSIVLTGPAKAASTP